MGFIHLHNHSDGSLLDGACRVEDMVDWAVSNSSSAVAITDHGNLFCAWDFMTKARQKGVNPIVGCEVYVAPGSRKTRGKEQGPSYHLTLLAENATGYKNLLKLVSLGYTEGFYRKPRIDMEILRGYNEGIIGLTGCVAGFVPKAISTSKEKGIANFKQLIDVLGKENIYAEVQNHYIKEEEHAYPVIHELAKTYNVPIVGTNDCHYLNKEDHYMHDILLCIQMKKTVNDPDRMTFDNHFYFKTYDEMKEALKMYPEEALTNTMRIAERCNIELDYGDNLLPEYEVPKGHTNDSYLKELCYTSLKKKYGELSTEIQKRLDYELEIIAKTGYAGYFLVVWDYVRFANNKGYPLSARGSGGSSLVLFALDVITFNPMDYGCFFERFLNLDRISPPDIDIDFSDRAREHVIQYLVDKYGHDSVGKVATFSTLSAKSAINDVGKALEIPTEQIKKITNLIPDSVNKFTIDDALSENTALRKVAELPENRELMDLAQKVEGMKRHVSCHASAIVVSNGPLTDYVPLFKDRNDQIATQYEGKAVEDIGIIKFDTLGIRSLTEVYDCLELIKENHGKEIKLTEIPFDDEPTFDLIRKGLLQGLFQLETSPGMKDVTVELRPENFEQFVAIPALYRPGPLKSGMAKQFISRKNGWEEITYLDPLLKDALESTYGVCVYQEQVMQIARDLAGFTMGEADILRSAMGKKNKPLLMEQREKFVAGAIKNGISKEKASEIFDLLEPFGQYAFNKSHTVAYSILAYRMAYLKTHYPHEFMAAMMTGEHTNTDKFIKYRNECVNLEEFLKVTIKLLPPDINESERHFSVNGNSILFGLIAINSVGEAAIEEILNVRKQGGKFKSFQDFCERINTKIVNKKTIENLIMCGSLDSFEGHRAQFLENIDLVMKTAELSKADKDQGQINLLDMFDTGPKIVTKMKTIEPWSTMEQLQKEKDQLGFYVSGHPLEEHRKLIKGFTNVTTVTAPDKKPNRHRKGNIFLIGLVTGLKSFKTRKGEQMASMEIEDLEGTINAIAFPNIWKSYSDRLENGMIVLVQGEISDDSRKKTKQLVIYRMTSIENVLKLTDTIEIIIPKEDDDENLEKLKKITDRYPGEKHLALHIGSIIIGSFSEVTYNQTFISEVEELFEKGCVFESNRQERDLNYIYYG